MEVTPTTPSPMATEKETTAGKTTDTDQGMMDTEPPSDNQTAMTDESDAKQSAFQQRLNVPTNDGTMRITV